MGWKKKFIQRAESFFDISEGIWLIAKIQCVLVAILILFASIHFLWLLLDPNTETSFVNFLRNLSMPLVFFYATSISFKAPKRPSAYYSDISSKHELIGKYKETAASGETSSYEILKKDFNRRFFLRMAKAVVLGGFLGLATMLPILFS